MFSDSPPGVILHRSVEFTLLSDRYLTRKRKGGEGWEEGRGSKERGEGREGEGRQNLPPPLPLEPSLRNV